MSVRTVLNAICKYWSLILAVVIAVSWFGGFIVTLSQIQTEQTALRVKLIELEQRQTKVEDKVNTQNLEVLHQVKPCRSDFGRTAQADVM